MKKITLTDKFYCVAMPDDSGNVYEFWLFHKDLAVATMMFGCKVDSEEEVISLAKANAENYFDDLYELAGEEA